MTKITESNSFNSLKDLNLESTANFNSDESVRKFADLLATAPHFNYCNIENQQGNRKIRVVVEYAAGVCMGAVVIKK